MISKVSFSHNRLCLFLLMKNIYLSSKWLYKNSLQCFSVLWRVDMSLSYNMLYLPWNLPYLWVCLRISGPRRLAKRARSRARRNSLINIIHESKFIKVTVGEKRRLLETALWFHFCKISKAKKLPSLDCMKERERERKDNLLDYVGIEENMEEATLDY